MSGALPASGETLPGEGKPLPVPREPQALSLSGTADLVITRELGKGGMGVVYEARQEGLERALAVKTLHAHLARGQAADRFLAEAAVTARLEHPNIVPVHAFGRDALGRPFICMQVIRGVEWAALIAPRTDAERARAAGMGLGDHLRILRRVCDAIAFAHSAGVIHRDLKPENVMIGAHGEALVTDWGIALALDERARPGERRPVVGTPAYLAPEMAHGDEAAQGPATDVFLLGGILYELLTGTPPHKGASFFEVLMAAGEGKVEPPATRAPDRAIAPELAAIAARALDASPALRFEDVPAFARALDVYVANQASVDLARAALGRLASLEQAIGAGVHAGEGPPRDERGERGAAPLTRREGPRRIHSGGEGGREPSHEAQSVPQHLAGLAGAISDLEQALAMWPGNAAASEGAARARVVSAEVALDQGDLSAAEAHLARVPDGAPGGEAARGRLESLRAAREADRRRARRLAAGIAAAVVTVALCAWFALREAGRAGVAEAAGERRRLALAAIDGAVWKDAEGQREAYTRAVALDPSFSQAYIDLAGCYSERAYVRRIEDPAGGAADLEEGRAVLGRLIDREPGNGSAVYLRGYCSEMLGELPRALPDYERTLALIPETHDGKAVATIIALVERRFADAERLATEALELAGDGDDFSHRSFARYALGRPLEGLADFRRAEVHAGGGDGDYDAITALFHLALGERESAAERLISSIRREPGWPRPYGLLAWNAAQRGDAESARALQAYGRERWRVHARCFAYVEPKLRTVSFAEGVAGRIGRAILLEEDLDAALPATASGSLQPEGSGRGFPSPGESVRLRAEGEERLRAGDTDGALALARRALALDPTDGPARFLRGRALGRLGLLEAARDDLGLVPLLAPQLRKAAEEALAALP